MLYNIFIRVTRKKVSYKFKKNLKLNDWSNNSNNNMLDKMELFVEENRLFIAKCQTVSNTPTGRYLSTIAVGPFKIKTFVENRAFYGHIHGICETHDISGEFINKNSVNGKSGDRWLIHDTQRLKPSEPNMQTNFAWSAGCFVLSQSDLQALADILLAYKIPPNEFIDGELVEVN